MIRRPMENRRERLAQMRRHYRVRGFDDGFAGRPAASTNIEYAQAWRRGREARAAERALPSPAEEKRCVCRHEQSAHRPFGGLVAYAECTVPGCDCKHYVQPPAEEMR